MMNAITNRLARVRAKREMQLKLTTWDYLQVWIITSVLALPLYLELKVGGGPLVEALGLDPRRA